MPDDGLRLIDVVEFKTSQPEVTHEYVRKAYTGYQIRLSVPARNYRFRARSCVGGPFRYDITDHLIDRAEATTNPFGEPTFGTLLKGHLHVQARAWARQPCGRGTASCTQAANACRPGLRTAR